MKWGCRGRWGHWGCWSCRCHCGCRAYKAWKITTEDFIVIQILEFGFTLMFWKKNRGEESWNIVWNFSALSVGGCWGQPMLFFWKLVDETQIFKPPDPTRRHNLIKLWILLPLRADVLFTLQCETPCRWSSNLKPAVTRNYNKKRQKKTENPKTWT